MSPFEWRDVEPSHYNTFQVKEAEVQGGLIALQVFTHWNRNSSKLRFWSTVTGYTRFTTGVYDSVEEAQQAAEEKWAEMLKEMLKGIRDDIRI